MAEPMKQQMGDGQDNYGQAAKEMAKAGKEFGKEIELESSCGAASFAAFIFH